ncbi:non-ribosomal peptide synthetase [Paraflavitalea pollutisoli]|uniref:non-ribosomal peptide synthetase n=1 Tax=Paraflavitalea pollutisoli TaxID=3034143 RepID=UPI0023EDC72A|nr:non-ribosomal peptide synthetase [Paraflavitalea sp. H1-2-19X]
MIAELYETLKTLKVRVRVIDGRLDVQAPKGAMNSELLAAIRLHKEALIGFIQSHQKNSQSLQRIPRAPEQADYPLSSAQQRLWVLSQSEQASIAYNMSGVYQLEGDLHPHLLESACRSVVERHESLRTVFRENEEGIVRQYILPADSAWPGILCRDLRTVASPETALVEGLESQLARPFALDQPLLCLYLYQLTDNQWVFAYVLHHIICDGWSINLLIREIITVYNALQQRLPDPLAPPELQYKDYVDWQQKQVAGNDSLRTYWLQQFKGDLPVLPLPSDLVRPAVKTFNGEYYGMVLDEKVVGALKALCRQQQATLYMGLLAACYTLCCRYTGQSDIVIGSPVAGRQHTDLESQIGFYANTLALRTSFSAEEGFDALLQGVKQTVTGAYEHQAYPFDELVEQLSGQRDISRNPLFDIQVLLQNADPQSLQQLEGLSIKKFEGAAKYIGAFDMVLNFVESVTALELRVIFNPDVYSYGNIERLCQHLQQLLAAIVQAPAMPLQQLDYLSVEEKRQVLHVFNDTQVNFGGAQDVIGLFRKQVASIPDALAVVYEGVTLTYRQLDEQSDLLAACLQQQYQVGKEDLVGVMIERSEKMMVAAYAILKAGGVYVPIDPEHPRNRKEFIFRDTRLKVLLTRTDLIFDLDYYDGALLALDIELTGVVPDVIPAQPAIDGAQLAYVIYTSGSTGEPKGAMITHASLANSMQAMNAVYEIRQREKFLQFYSLSFDVSVFEIFSAPVAGAEMHIIKDEDRKNPALLEAFLIDRQIEIAGLPTALLHQLQIDQLTSLKKLIVGGEPSNPEDVAAFIKTGTLFNAYGPTETTICASLYRIDQGSLLTHKNIPIGRPIANDRIYILDNQGNLVPVGVVGELCIGGMGLARGYLNRPDLTMEKFVPNPFVTGERIYRTGDLAKWLPDGNLVFIGRKDEQVKIRGYRIEVGEIEFALQQYESIDGALVVVRELPDGGKELVAYLIGNADLQAPALRSWLSRQLPAYMVPAQFVQVDAWPLTTNGKIDKRKLPDPAVHGLRGGAGYVAARTDAEEQLVAVCEAVLKKQPIGIGDDFFVLGGDSIKSIQVVSRLKQRGYSLTIQDVLQYPVLEELAGRMSLSGRSIGQEVVQGAVPLGPVQHWFFNNGSKAFAHYNQSMLLRSRGPLSEAGLRAALMELVKHHDALRMVFRATPQGWVQENLGLAQGYGFTVVTGATGDSFVSHCEEIQSGMDLQTGPLLKACLFRGEAEDRLLLVIHHLVTDGVSWRILLEDLEQLYVQHQAGEALTLPLKTDAFRDWQLQQGSYAQSEALLQEDQYWSSLSQHDFASLPVDREGGSNLQESIANCSFALTAEQTERFLLRCYKSYRTGPNEVLLTGLGLALKRVWGLNRVLVNLEGHGREDIGGGLDTSRTVGWFTSMYPVLLDMGRSADRLLQLIGVKEDLQAVPGRGIGYGILRYLRGRDYGLSPAINFNYLGDFGRGGSGDQVLVPSGEAHGRNIGGGWQRDCLLDITGITVGGQLGISISYSTGQYDAATMERLMTAYRQELEGLIDLLSDTAGEYLTPSDLGYKELSIGQCLALNTKGDLEDVYTLSPLQEGLYYQWLMWPQSGAYFEQMSYRVAGVVDIDLLGQSYQRLVARHAVLRTSFRHDLGNKPVQIVRKGVLGDFDYADRSGDSSFNVADWRSADRARGFNLQEGSQMRLQVVRVADGEYEFLWSHHHILMDGWCVSILIREFFAIYHGLLQGRVEDLPKPPAYAQYIKWLGKQDSELAMSYWKQYLTGMDTMSLLPGKQSADGTVFRPQFVGFSLDEPLRKQLQRLCATLGVTESTFIQTAWALVLARYTNSSDVVFGAVVSGRPAELEGVEEMIGMFINTIPVRIDLSNKATVTDLLRAAQQASLDNLPYRYLPLGAVREVAGQGRELFNHIMLFENFPVQELVQQEVADQQESHAITMTGFEVYGRNNFDLTIMVTPGDSFHIRFDYNGSVYDAAQMTALSGHFEYLIQQMVEQPQVAHQELSCLREAERQELLVSFNAVLPNFEGYRPVVDLFGQQVQLHPEAIAVQAGDANLTYCELQEQSDGLAAHLVSAYGIQPGDRIGILLDRSVAMITAIWSILKAGAAYVPIDPDYPLARREHIMADAGIAVLLTQSDYLFELGNYSGQVMALDIQLDGIEGSRAMLPPSQKDGLAYVIYTSGSTGHPKGVAISHSNLSNYIQWANKYYFKGHEPASFGLFTSLSFDLTVTCIFCTLTQGGTLTIFDHRADLSQVLTANFRSHSGINSIKLTPSHINLLRYLPLQGTSIQRAIVGGEQLTAEQVDILQHINPAIEIYNEYGPTETTVGCIVAPLKSGEPVIIGKPIAHTHIYLLTDAAAPVPVGVPGEICIGGAGVARGYLNKEALTTERFVEDPFRAGERMYRTGDLGKWLPDGNIVFIGRKDAQLKIRGYRIEPGEIENALCRSGQVDAALVLPGVNKTGEQELIAYVTGAADIDPVALRHRLSQQLPAWMLPAHIWAVDAFPLTTNGKVDKDRLPVAGPVEDGAGVSFASPRNELEEQLTAIWCEVLGRDRVGIADNFFEVGGNSLRIVKLSAAVSQLLQKDISVAQLFEYPSIKSLVEHVVPGMAVEEEQVVDAGLLVDEFSKFNIEEDEYR